MTIVKSKEDVVGALASLLCFLHCASTPFLLPLLTAASFSNNAALFQWWGYIDVIFLCVSFLAVVYAAKTTAKQWVGYALWSSWIALTAVIFNEKQGWLHLPEVLNYIPALLLIFFHLYNRRYCQCEDENCCIDE